MTPRVRVNGIPLGATTEEVRDLLTAHSHTRYPVFDGDLDHIIGMLHVKDLLRKIVADQPVAQADLRPIPVVPTTTALDDVLTLMQRSHAHMAIVIDEHGGTAGIVSLEDLFDEVVGEIEEGAPAASLARQPDGSVRAAGTVRVEELGQAFDIDLSHEDVDSVSGLVLARLDRSPDVGDVVEYGRIRLEVTATSGHGVAEVRATLLPEQDDAR
jgi:CBS domain containing-hemolysin-like protein